ncbi:DinB family protein [Streptomyces zagrosensis]|uniref:Putative damage-inducible protein DinB n=1 Tax=Streptomyces zagrosensis TaxID=1042984 RepID=A0A7W9Q910_9ACTN|nr:DinB family protein [Streptomyces zagrosensis]MBB5935839.1 putative damage-inducible protein DinB [Streptomyces zagrosensis]
MTNPATPLDEPPHSLADQRALIDGYLDYYRDTLIRKLEGLSEQELRSSQLPSGWTPLQLVKHLTYVEFRWLVWGFQGEPMSEERAWGDRGPEDRWYVADDEPVAAVLAEHRQQCIRSREIAANIPAERRASLGGRFSTQEQAPTLGWILFHVFQEYARHVGHLDVSRELADGAVGE